MGQLLQGVPLQGGASSWVEVVARGMLATVLLVAAIVSLLCLVTWWQERRKR